MKEQPVIHLKRGGLKLWVCIFTLFLMVSLAGCDDDPQNGASSSTEVAEGEYLTPELREKVDALKAAVANTPTTRETFAERAMIVWPWLNAWALHGGVVDPELPNLISYAGSNGGKNGWGYKGSTAEEWLDHGIRDLSFREDNRRAFGVLKADLGPFVAQSYQTLRQTYTLGEQDMEPGGGILVARHYMSDYAMMQIKDPAGEGYVRVTSSNKAARFTPAVFKMGGIHGSNAQTGDPFFFTLEGTTLKKGDSITVTYGDKSKGGPGMRVESFAIDRFPLPLYVSFDDSRALYFLPLQPIVLIGKPASGVHGFAPSIVGVGEKITLSVRSEDEYYNRASGNIPGYRVFLNGKPYREIVPGKNPITLLDDISFSAPGVYRFTFESLDGKIKGLANPILVKENPTTRIFWGEEHGHSGLAEGQGLAQGYFTFARDDARLDFAGHTDHDGMMDDAEWEEVRANVQEFNKEGEFIAFLAYEWSARIEMGGHHNVLFRTPEGRKRVPIQTNPGLSSLYQTLRDDNDLKDVLVIPHYHQGDWRFSDPKLQNLVEVMSAHGTFEWYAQKFLKQGAQVGFAAGSDDHFNHPGYSSPWFNGGGMLQQGGLTAVMANARTSNDIFNALKEGRTYATTQERIILDAAVNDAPMGTRIKFSPKRRVAGSVIGTGALDRIDFLKISKVVRSFDFAGADQSTGRYQLSLESDSTPPFDLQLQARSARRWNGWMRINKGTLKDIRTLGFDNPRIHKFDRDANDPNLVRFSAITVGNNNGFDIMIDGTADTEIEISLEGIVEYLIASSQPPKDAAKSNIPPQHFTIRMAGLGKEGKTVSLPVPDRPYADRVIVRPIKTSIPMEAKFSFDDTDEFGVGDYYYVRVRQLDGALAWSSPVWIGGFPVQ